MMKQGPGEESGKEPTERGIEVAMLAYKRQRRWEQAKGLVKKLLRRELVGGGKGVQPAEITPSK